MLGDPNYTSKDMYVMHHIGNHKLALRENVVYFSTYNRVHVGHMLRMKWGNGSLKHKWQKLVKLFDFTK